MSPLQISFLLLSGLSSNSSSKSTFFSSTPLLMLLINQRGHYCQDCRRWTLFIFIFSFIFSFFCFSFAFIFYFQNNSGQGLSVTLSHQSQLDGVVTRLIMGLRRMKQKKLEQSDVIQHGHHMLASYITHGHLGQGAQQLARTMEISI